jgi:hypothetical protein
MTGPQVEIRDILRYLLIIMRSEASDRTNGKAGPAILSLCDPFVE